MTGPVSPLAPAAFPDLPPLDGVRLATRACGIKYRGRTDVCLIELSSGATVAGVLTRSLTASAPIEWCRAALPGGRVRAILVNSGNANAFTGARGANAVKTVVGATASALGCPKKQVLVASTGVIGEPLPDGWVKDAVLEALQADLDADAWAAAAKAIMTTDTFPKGASRRTEIAGSPVTLNGIAKGSGMIAPDMATMLAFVCTDAKLPADAAPILDRPRRRPLLQRHHGGRRHLDQRHPAAGRERPGAPPEDRRFDS